MQTFLKHRLTLVTSILYIFDKYSTLVIPFENPCSCKRNSWLYTCFTNWEFGIWYNWLKKLSNDIWHDTLGGNCPHSPIAMKFDVVALTLNMQRIYRKNTRSKSSRPDLQKPHTSLPYVRIGLTRESNRYNIFQVLEALYFCGPLCANDRFTSLITEVLVVTKKNVLAGLLYSSYNDT